MSDTPQSPTAQADRERENSHSVAHWSPASFSLLSVLLPGAGQIAQRRFGAAALQLATVGAYLGAAASVGGGRALLLALAWNAWSAIDAWWHAPDAYAAAPYPSGGNDEADREVPFCDTELGGEGLQ